ncbi:MAG: thiamine-binding protein [Woeseiaceae bacterium]
MKVAVDISLYPLNERYSSPIKDVIERLHAYDSVEVWTNAMSTQMFGEFDDVMKALHVEIGTTFEENPKAVFTIRILNNPVTH